MEISHAATSGTVLASGIIPLAPLQAGHASRLIISTNAHRRIWVLLFLVNLLNAGHLFLLTTIYWTYNLFDQSFLRMLVSTFLFEPEERFMDVYSKWIGATYALLCVVFAGHCLQMLIVSVRHRELRFGDELTDNVSITHPTEATAGGESPSASGNPGTTCFRVRDRGLYNIIHNGRRVWNKLEVLWADHGVRGKYFHRGLILRECVELILQTAQGYNASLAISNKYILQGYGIVIAFNGIMHPLLSLVFEHNSPMHRFASVFAEFFLDVSWGCVLPLWMFMPYLQLDLSTTIELILSKYPVGFREMANGEVRQNLVLSAQAYILSIFPFVGSLLSLRGVKRLLSASMRRNVATSSIAVQPFEQKSNFRRQNQCQGVPKLHTGQTSTEIVSSDKKSEVSRHHPAVVPAAASRARPNRSVLLAYVFIAVYGFLVLAISIDATGGIHDFQWIPEPACVYRLSPWFVRKDACTLWCLNCTEWGISGLEHELAGILPYVHQSTLSAIVIVACPALEFPVEMVQLQNLLTITIADSQMQAWPPEASITSENFPRLSVFSLKRTSIAPETVLQIRSKTLQKFVTRDVLDMDRIAEAMTTQWHYLTTWSCYGCTVTRFPAILFASPDLEKLLLAGSTISETADSPETHDANAVWPSLERLILAGNPQLTMLSDTIWGAAVTGSMLTLNLRSTNVSAIPDKWLQRLPSTLVIDGFESPLCENATLRAMLPRLNCEFVVQKFYAQVRR